MLDEDSYNPNDPAFLLSRSLDEELTAEEQERLDAALAESASLRAEAEQLGAVKRLIRRWGSEPPSLDSETHAALIIAQAATGDDADMLEKIDRLIDRWGSAEPEFDADRFTAAVMGLVSRGSGSKKRQAWVFRLGTPLAAAAAIAIVVISSVWWAAQREVVCRIEVGRRVAMGGASASANGGRSTIVSFDRTVVEPVMEAHGEMSFGAVGSSALAEPYGESPPL
jgi:hypothetical protein